LPALNLMNSGRPHFDACLLGSLLLLAVLTSVMATVSFALDFKTGPSSASLASSKDVTIWLNGDAVGMHPGWNDTSPGPTMTVVSGVTVNLYLNATDFLSHNWYIDINNNSQPDPNEISSPDFSPNAKALLFTFTPIIGQNIPSAGNWTYKCRYHPHSMYGTIRVIQPNFSMSSSPASLATSVRTMGTSTIAVNLLFGFTGTVSLSTAGTSGLQTTISPGTVSGTSGVATLTVIAANAENYTATITGTSGSLTLSLNVTVEARDFTITADPSVAPAQINTVATSAITIGAINHFDGTVSLAGNSTMCFVSPTMVISLGMSTLSCTFASSGQFVVNVTATNGSLVHSGIVTFDVAVPDYLVASGLNSETLLAGQAGNSTISVQSINGFTGIVSLSESNSQGLNCTISSASITLGASGTATLSCRGNAGIYTVTVLGTSGVTSRSASISYTVQDFHITGSQATLAMDAGGVGKPTIIIVPLEGFSGNVSFKIASSTGLATTVSPSSIVGGSGTVTLTLSAAIAGNYTVNVTAVSATITRLLKLTAQVQDFTIISSSTTFDINVKQARASSIRISSINHFARTVTMTSNNTYCDISPIETTPGNATLSCNFPVEGTFHISVIATSGSLSHSMIVTYVASNVQQTPGTDLLLFFPITAAISLTALGGALVYLFMRHRAAIHRRTATNLSFWLTGFLVNRMFHFLSEFRYPRRMGSENPRRLTDKKRWKFLPVLLGWRLEQCLWFAR
jgi:plastocyanin